MNVKTTLALLLVAAVIGILIWVAPRPSARDDAKPAAQPTARAEKPVFDPPVKLDAIRRVELEPAGRPRLVFESIPIASAVPGGQTEYRIIEPVTGQAEGFQVRGLVSTVIGLQSRERFVPGQGGQPAASELGLQPPVAVVRLTDEAGKTHVLEIGKKVVMSESTYVRRGGEQEVHVTTVDVLPQVRKEIEEFRGKKLLDFRVDEVTGAKIVQQDQATQVSRGPAGDWLIESPVRAAADREKVRALLTRLSNARLDAFIADAPAGLSMYGLEAPAMMIEVTTSRALPATRPADPADTQPAPQETVQTTHRLLVGAPAGLDGKKRYVKLADAPWVADISQAAVDGFVPDLRELRDPRVLRVAGPAVTRLEISSGNDTAVVEKSEGAWRGVSGVTEVDQGAIAELLSALESLRAVNYVDAAGDPRAPDAAYGLAAPRAVITVTASGQIEPTTLRIGSTTGTGQNAYVQRDSESGLIVVTAAQAEKLAIGTLALRSKQIFNLSPDSIRGVQVTRAGLTRRIERGESGWSLVEPAGAPLNAPDAGALVTNLARLRAVKLLDPASASKISFADPFAVIRFEATQESQPAGDAAGPPAREQRAYELRLARAENVGYGQAGEEAFAFELDGSTFDALTAELIDPALLRLDPNSVSALEVASDRGRLAFNRDGTRWVFVPDPTVNVPADRVRQIVDAVSNLKADVYLAWSGANLATLKLEPASPASILVTMADGTTHALRFRPDVPGGCPVVGALTSEGRAFRIPEAECETIFKSVEDLLKPEAPAPRPMPPGAPGMPGMP